MVQNTKKIVVGLSGGIDSTVTALLLRDAGYDVIGVTLLMQPQEDAEAQKSCGGEDAVGMATRVAAQLQIPHHIVECRARFECAVLKPCWQTFSEGRTPNPCVICNRQVKFRVLLDFADQVGACYVATGHYARIAVDAQQRPRLLRGVDANKDQSYFLHALTPDMLARIQFPLGGLCKPEVRALGQQYGLINAARAESQDVCFAGPEGHVAEQLRLRYSGHAVKGVFKDETGRVVGRHNGIHQLTIGQRRGLGVALGKPAKIIAIHAQNGDVVLSDRPEASYGTQCDAQAFYWHVAADRAATYSAQVRYRQKPVPADLRAVSDTGSDVSVTFAEPVFGITPGQALVLYDGDAVVGGGTIVRA